MAEYEVFEFSDAEDGLLLEAINAPAVLPVLPNHFFANTREEILAEILALKKWRFHHDFEELKAREDSYHAYFRRVEAMFDMIERAFETYSIDLTGRSVVDLAAAEGFFSFRARETWNCGSVDAFELNLDQIQRAQLVQAYRGITDVMFRRVDFESAGWALRINQVYDMVFCLGIVYHLQNPMLFLRNVFHITNKMLLIESDTPRSSDTPNEREVGRISLLKGQVTLEPGSIRQLIEFRPNRDALIAMLGAVGFKKVIVLPPSPVISDPYFNSGEKSLLLAMK